MKIKPLGDRVVIKMMPAEEKTKSGIYLPETAKEKPEQGEIVAAGPGRWDEDGEKRIPLEVKVGDKVMFSKYAPNEIKVDGEELFIIKEEDILAIIG